MDDLTDREHVVRWAWSTHHKTATRVAALLEEYPDLVVVRLTSADEHRGTSIQHVYTSAEVTRLVTDAGFTQVTLYGDTDATPFRLGNSRLLLLARQR